MAANDDWGDLGAAATLRPLTAAVGAFPLPEGSRDAALAVRLGGANSGAVYDTGNRAGVALVELYDAGGGAGARLVNASVLNFAGTGDDVLIVGFQVRGTGPRRLLVRAIGPALAAFGRPGFLPDPRLALVTADGTVLASNDDWGSGDLTELRGAFRAAGAFDLPDPASRDAAFVVTVLPGLHSAVVSAGGGQTGEALLEVYELP